MESSKIPHDRHHKCRRGPVHPGGSERLREDVVIKGKPNTWGNHEILSSGKKASYQDRPLFINGPKEFETVIQINNYAE
jgi:hypothetical protein